MNHKLTLLIIALTCPMSLCAEEQQNNSVNTKPVKKGKTVTIHQSSDGDDVKIVNEEADKTSQPRFVVNYTYSYERKEGLISGSSRTGTSNVLFPNSSNNFSSQKLNTQRASLDFAFIGEDEKSITAVRIPYVDNRMITNYSDVGVNASFLSESSGFGDIEIVNLSNVFSPQREHVLYIGTSWLLPTGSIDEDADNPVQGRTQLPFAMQLGTGSFAIEPMLIYVNREDPFNFGFALGSRFYLNRNDNGYKLGDAYYVNIFSKFHVTDWFAPKIELDFIIEESIDGRDKTYVSTNDLSRDPGNTGGTYLDAKIGMTLFKGIDIGLSLPVYQHVKGIQLEKGWKVSLSTRF